MYAQKINLLEFLGSSKRTFNIPVYQRNYDWQESQCKKLFKDIEKIASSNNKLEHFLGTVVYLQSKVSANFQEFTVIDGQQRITTITLLLKALHELIADDNVRDDIEESYIINKRASEELRIKLKPIESDMFAYQKLLKKETSECHSNIYRNYNLFLSLIENSEKSPIEIFEALSNIDIVYIQLETDKKSENPQLIFESLNSTGLSLTQGDLIRNFLLMNHSYDEQSSLYKNYWLKIEKLLTNSKISDFVRDYLTMKTSSISKKAKVYEDFKDYSISKDLSEKYLLEDLLKFAQYYSYFLHFNSNNQNVNYYLENFLTLKSTTVYPLLLYIFDCHYSSCDIDSNELVEILKILLSYIFRRLICDYPSNALNKVFAVTQRELESKFGNLSSTNLLNILANKTLTSIFPRDKDFENSFKDKQIYKTHVDKYTLSQLEKWLSKENVRLDNVTIEHIMPQSLTPQWQLSLDDDNVHKKYLNTIGNLTLTAYNSELSNKSFEDKKEIYDKSNIAITRQICSYESWGKFEINKRAECLTDIALKIWHLPEKYNKELKPKDFIDYATVYSLKDSIMVRGTKPKQITICDEEITVNSWKDFIVELSKYLYELDNTIFENFIKHKDFVGRERYIINNTKDNIRAPYQISEKIYIETNLDSQKILNYCKLIAEHYGFLNDIFFMLRK